MSICVLLGVVAIFGSVEAAPILGAILGGLLGGGHGMSDHSVDYSNSKLKIITHFLDSRLRITRSR